MSSRWLFGMAAAAAAASLTLPAAAAHAAAPRPATLPAAQAAAQSAVTAATQAPKAATTARRLFGAWLRDDRTAAATFATPAAVNTLFAYVFRAPDTFAGCVAGACAFRHTSVRVPGELNGILMIVSGGKVAKVYTSRHYSKEKAARHLLGAWHKGDRNQGAEVATAAALKTLFKVKWDPHGVPYTFQGCEKSVCFWSYEGGAMLMHVAGSKARGYEVRSISYVAD
ncbi:hypothetical protein [Nonomuraea sp. bgisy101]|uniref:hypothetical protein n=1 Tax=Nonomuraea sp. bgisy101 TaxID=3413784 RepID=UPI003D74B61C